MELHAKVGSIDEQQTYCDTALQVALKELIEVEKHGVTDSEHGAVLCCCRWASR